MSEDLTQLLEELKQEHADKLDELRNTKWTDDVLKPMMKALKDPTSPMAALGAIQDISTSMMGNYRQKMRYKQFQLLPRLAKLRFEDYCTYMDACEKISASMIGETMQILQTTLGPKLLEMLDELDEEDRGF